MEGVVFLVGSLGTVDQDGVCVGGGRVVRVYARGFVVAVDLRRGALVVGAVPGLHGWEVVELVAGGWAEQFGGCGGAGGAPREDKTKTTVVGDRVRRGKCLHGEL